MVIDIKDCLIKFKDGTTPTAKEITVKIGEGNLTFSEKKPRNYIRDRGRLDTVRNGDEEPVDVSIDAEWVNITANGITGATPTVSDVLKKAGPASTWVSTSSDPCEPYAIDIEITHDPECSQQLDEVIVLPDFRYESLDFDLRAGTIRISGKANVTEANASRVIATT